MVFTMEEIPPHALLTFACCGIVWYVVSSLSKKEPTASKENIEIADVEASGRPATTPLAVAQVPPSPAKPRMYFLDNLKAFLTVVVICHHVIESERLCAPFIGATFCVIDEQVHAPPPAWSSYNMFADVVLALDLSYFMALFFFISGYCTPSSLDRKGAGDFMRDRFKRIGIPAVVYFFVFGPFQFWLMMTLGKISPTPSSSTSAYHYHPKASQCWYLFWLLFLSFVYACMRQAPLRVPSPGPVHIFLFAIALGIWFVLVPCGGFFAMVPCGGRSLPYYILCFSAGIVAKRNDWLTEMVKLQTESCKGVAASLCPWGVSAFIMASMIAYESAQPGSTHQKMHDFFLGLFAVIISLAELKLFHACFNKCGRVSKFLSQGAYAAFLIHYIFISLGFYVYFHLLMQFSGLPADTLQVWQNGNPGTLFVLLTNQAGVTAGEGEKYRWIGALFVIAFANLCTWPCAYILHKLPLLNQVL